jgi:hypothetical protein
LGLVELSAGWHAIGQLPPGARAAAVLLPVALLLLGIWLSLRHPNLPQ